MAVKVAKKQVTKLFLELGFKGVDKWDAKRLKSKIDMLPKLAEDDDLDLKDEDLQALMDQLVNAVEKEKGVEVVSDDDEEDDDDKPLKNKKKEANGEEEKPKAKKKDDDDEEEEKPTKSKKDDDEDDEKPKAKNKPKDDDDEDDDDKPKKKGQAPKSAGGEGKPGIIASLTEFLKAASSEKKALTKEALLNKLADRFPDRDREAMGKTVAVQVPNRMRKEKGLKIEKVDKEGKAAYYVAD